MFANDKSLIFDFLNLRKILLIIKIYLLGHYDLAYE